MNNTVIPEGKWSGKTPPPAIGEDIDVTMNDLGHATVLRYQVVEEWLGLIVRFHNPPAWYIRQNGAQTPGLVFGAEMRALPATQA